MGRRAVIAGVGMTPFRKPGTAEGGYPAMAAEAARAALADAGIAYEDVEQVAVGYVFGDTASGQRAMYEVGMTGVPILNVNNACATGSSGVAVLRQLVEGGACDVALAVGVEQMAAGPLVPSTTDRVLPLDPHIAHLTELAGPPAGPITPWVYGEAGREHMARYGTPAEAFAQVAVKNRAHAAANPRAQFREPVTIEEVLGSRMIHEPLTKLQCSPTSDGAAAVVLLSDAEAARRGVADRSVEIAAQSMVSDPASTFADRSAISLVGVDMTRTAADRVYEQAGIGPEDLDVVELHDCFSVNEVLTCEALGLAPEGKGGELVLSGATTYGGSVVVNPSGGLLAKGHPLGATGVAQLAELVWQLRGDAGERQVAGARWGLAHNMGLGGAAVVTALRAPSGGA